MKIAIGNDHAGTLHKKMIVKFLEKNKIDVINYGTDSEESVDYPDFAHLVAKDVDTHKIDKGILLCGTGNGVAITANKYKGVRAGLCWNEEIVRFVRKHNDANVLVLPARFIDLDTAVEMVHIFIEQGFEGGRHTKRVNKISQCI